MKSAFESFSEELDKARSLICFLKEANNLTSIKEGRLYAKRIKEYCLSNIELIYNKLNYWYCTKFSVEDLNIVFDFSFSQSKESNPKDCEYLLEKDLFIFYVEQYLSQFNVKLMSELFKSLITTKKIDINLFKHIVSDFVNSQHFENCVIHELTHRLQFNNTGKNAKAFAKKNNKEYCKNMYEFYAIKADLFNRCCRELENEGIKDFTFEQLKNKMSHQGNGNYYKQLINYKGMKFFDRMLMKDYNSYKKYGTLLENNSFSEEYFNKLKRYCTTEEEKKIVDDPEWRKWFIDITIKASEEFI